MPSTSAHLEALEARHAAISHKIESEQRGLGVDDLYIRMLKQQKLHLKEMIEGISGK